MEEPEFDGSHFWVFFCDVLQAPLVTELALDLGVLLGSRLNEWPLGSLFGYNMSSLPPSLARPPQRSPSSPSMVPSSSNSSARRLQGAVRVRMGEVRCVVDLCQLAREYWKELA